MSAFVEVGDLVTVGSCRFPEVVTWTDYDENFPIRTNSGWYAVSEVVKVATTQSVTLFRTVDEHGEAWSPSWQFNDFYMSLDEAVEAAGSPNWDHPELTIESSTVSLVWRAVRGEGSG